MKFERGHQLKECAEYFHRNKGFDRAFVLIRQKIESLGKTSGKVTLQNADRVEREALQCFLAKPFNGDSISFSLKSFEEALSETKFNSITLKELVEEYFNETIISNKDRKLKASELKSNIRNDIENRIRAKFGKNNRLSLLLGDMSDNEFNKLVQTCNGRSYIPTDENQEQITDTVLNVISPIGKAVKILSCLGNTTIRLAVLALNCTGNPHAFDRDRTEGKLLLKALLNMAQDSSVKQKTPLSAEEILDLYISSNIRPDDISSFTVLYGIRLYNGDNSHPAYDSFIERREFYLTSLSNLSSVTRAIPVNKKVFIVENQMVFSQLCEACPKASIICTSGQMKTASLLVIDLLCNENCILYYNGDFDGEGLSIANRLIKRNSKKIRLWHMNVEDYKNAVSSVELDENRLKKLGKIDNPELLETIEMISETKRAGYQERILDTLISDINLSLFTT